MACWSVSCSGCGIAKLAFLSKPIYGRIVGPIPTANSCYHNLSLKQQTSKPDVANRAATLAQQLSDALVRERVVPRFVDSYVVEHGRYGLQVHATLYRDLLTLLQREALITMCAAALEIVSKGTSADSKRKPAPLTRKEATAFRQKFMAALARHQHWNAGAALEFQSDLQMYEDILARASSHRRSRKPFEAANHPFVDRGGFLLDSSFLENARLAASRALTGLEELTERITEAVLHETSASNAAKQS